MQSPIRHGRRSQPQDWERQGRHQNFGVVRSPQEVGGHHVQHVSFDSIYTQNFLHGTAVIPCVSFRDYRWQKWAFVDFQKRKQTGWRLSRSGGPHATTPLNHWVGTGQQHSSILKQCHHLGYPTPHSLHPLPGQSAESRCTSNRCSPTARRMAITW